MSPNADRRTVLAGAVAAAGATAGLTSCASADDKPAPKKTTSSAPISVPKANVPAGGGVVVEKAVVTQPNPGEYKAFTNICPHQGCKVSFVKDKQIVCACHSSEFSISDGSRTSGPAKQGLTEKPVKVEGDQLVIG